jgi:hypothetical protein
MKKYNLGDGDFELATVEYPSWIINARASNGVKNNPSGIKKTNAL